MALGDTFGPDLDRDRPIYPTGPGRTNAQIYAAYRRLVSWHGTMMRTETTGWLVSFHALQVERMQQIVAAYETGHARWVPE